MGKRVAKGLTAATPTTATHVANKAYVDAAVPDSIVNDTTPQLGGDLDVNGNKLVSVSNGNIELAPHGSGKVKFGTHAAVTAETVTGFITILDASGTPRKIAVVS